jgi:twitching motility protein PilT
VIDVFPTEQQRQARGMLAGSLAAVASQLLLRTADGKGRIAAIELLLRTTGLANVIREGNTPMINSIIQGGRKEGMQMMDDALFAYAREGKITGEDAWLKAGNKKRFEEFAPK